MRPREEEEGVATECKPWQQQHPITLPFLQYLITRAPLNWLADLICAWSCPCKQLHTEAPTAATIWTQQADAMGRGSRAFQFIIWR